MTVITTNTDTGAAVNVEVAQTEQSFYIQSYASVLSDTATAIHSISSYYGTTVYNAGTVLGDIGINLEGSNDLITNAAGGHIGGHTDGIKLNGNVNYLNNYGTIDCLSNAAIYASNSSYDVIYNAGTISGGTGISLYNSAETTITNAGTINSISAIYSTGTIYSNPDVSSDFYIVVNNTGTIYGRVTLNNFSPTLHNSGVIHGDVTLGRGTGLIDGLGGTIDGDITGGPGNDLFDLSHQTVTGTIAGGGGIDTIGFGSASGGFAIDLVQGTASGAGEAFDFSGIEHVVGSRYADTIYGDAADNVIAAGAGNDVVSGGAGNDTIDGGAGDDTMSGGTGINTLSYVNAGAGVTISLGSPGQAQVTGGAGTDTVANFQNLIGSNYNDSLTGDANANVIHGGAGNDAISGGNGNDTLYGDDGNDTIVGGTGNDVIEGDYGRDTLTGGAGADKFVFKYYSDSSVAAPDLITDFVSGTDKIDISALHDTAKDTFAISSSGGYTYVTVDYSGDGSVDSLIKLTGTSVVKTSDVIWANATFPAAVHHATASEATPAADHHTLVATLHAAAMDHGLVA